MEVPRVDIVIGDLCVATPNVPPMLRRRKRITAQAALPGKHSGGVDVRPSLLPLWEKVARSAG